MLFLLSVIKPNSYISVVLLVSVGGSDRDHRSFIIFFWFSLLVWDKRVKVMFGGQRGGAMTKGKDQFEMHQHETCRGTETVVLYL